MMVLIFCRKYARGFLCAQYCGHAWTSSLESCRSIPSPTFCAGDWIEWYADIPKFSHFSSEILISSFGRTIPILFCLGGCHPYRLLQARVDPNLWRWFDTDEPVEPSFFLLCLAPLVAWRKLVFFAYVLLLHRPFSTQFLTLFILVKYNLEWLFNCSDFCSDFWGHLC